MIKDQIVRNLKHSGIPSDQFNIEVLERGKRFRLTLYSVHHSHATLPYTLYARYITRESPILAFPTTYIIQG